MYATCIVFFMLWLVYAWVWKATPLLSDDSISIQLDAPLLPQNCSTQEVPCIDDCSFLCIEKDSECIGGICQPKENIHPISCQTETGGILMMVQDPTPHWSCICTDSRFYGGAACDQLNPDVCERGTFFYIARMRFICLCAPPFTLIKIDSKPHCMEENMMGFYDESFMSKTLL